MRGTRSVVSVALVAVVFFCGGFATAYGQQADAKKDAPAAAAPIATDAPFQEVLSDYQMILREIERLEGATGTVEIPVSISQLRERANIKMGKIRGWMKEHNVSDDWRYDAEHRAFLPPAKVEAKKP